MRSIVRIFILIAVAASPLYAQKTSVLTFEEAVKIGVDRNIDLATQKNQLYSSQARRTQGYANYLPNISANGFAQRTDGLQIDPTTGEAGNVSSDYIQGSVQANYTLFNGFNRINTLKSNNNLFFAQTHLVDRTRQQVVANVTTQYLQVLLDQELLRIAEENLNTQNVLLEQTQGLVDVGSRAQADAYSQDALVQNTKVAYLRAKMTLDNDRATLAQTLQLDPSVHFTLEKPSFENNFEYFKSLSLDSLYQIALQNRADLKQQNALVDAGRFSVRAASSGYFPTVTLFVSYGSTYYASSNIGQPESFRTQFTELNPSLSYGVNVNIPIFDRLQTRTNRVAAKVLAQNAALTRDNTIKSIKIDVQRAFKNFENAIESYEASLVQYQAGKLALDTQQESYRLGVSTQVAVAQANQTFVQAASSKAQAEVTLLFQQMLLEFALGTLKVDKLVNP